MHTAPPTPRQDKKETGQDTSSFDVVKATQYGAFDRVQEILDSGFDVNQRDSENVTLLHWAAINNRLEIVKFYIKRGADVDAVGGELMSTPLHWASRQGHIAIIVQLMTAGANSALRDGEGCAALHLAAQFGHTAIVGYLIAKGESVNCVDSNGMTPLMWASYRTASIDPIRLLITLGSNFTATDNLHGNTALHWAIQVSQTSASCHCLIMFDSGQEQHRDISASQQGGGVQPADCHQPGRRDSARHSAQSLQELRGCWRGHRQGSLQQRRGRPLASSQGPEQAGGEF